MVHQQNFADVTGQKRATSSSVMRAGMTSRQPTVGCVKPLDVLNGFQLREQPVQLFMTFRRQRADRRSEKDDLIQFRVCGDIPAARLSSCAYCLDSPRMGSDDVQRGNLPHIRLFTSNSARFWCGYLCNNSAPRCVASSGSVEKPGRQYHPGRQHLT